MRSLLGLVLPLLFACLVCSLLTSMTYKDVCPKYDGHVETSYNRSPFINPCNKRCKVPQGSPYCATVTDSILEESEAERPILHQGWARAYISDDAIKATDVFYGRDTIPEYCLVVFVRRGGGHVGFFIEKKVINGEVWIRTFEPNTSPDGRHGSQFDGTWTGYKWRRLKDFISPYATFRITHFVPVYYDKERLNDRSRG